MGGGDQEEDGSTDVCRIKMELTLLVGKLQRQLLGFWRVLTLELFETGIPVLKGGCFRMHFYPYLPASVFYI